MVRTLPSDAAAEEAVLGGVLSSPELMPEVAAVVAPGDFYASEHGAIFAAMLALDRRGVPPDVVATVGEMRGRVDPMRIRDLAAGTGIASTAPKHAERVASLARSRRVVGLLGSAIESAYAGPTDPARLATDVVSDLLDATAGPNREGAPLGRLVDDAVSELERPTDVGLRTGFRSLDSIVGGLRPGQLVIVASRPGVGKTSLAASVARFVARSTPVAFFSLEMTAEEIAMRMLCADASVNYVTMRAGRGGTDDWARLLDAAEELVALPLVVFDQVPVKLADVRAAARRTRGLGLVVVDYVQLMVGTGQNRQEQVAEISRGLKTLAKELKVPVLACAQLNREVERRQDKRPQLADLRESGALEQDPDVVVLLHREASDPARSEAIVAKQRNGPTGTARLTFVRESTSFREGWDREV